MLVAAQRKILDSYTFLLQFPFSLKHINAIFGDVGQIIFSKINPIFTDTPPFLFYNSIVESTITIVDFFKTPIVEFYNSIVEKKRYDPT